MNALIYVVDDSREVREYVTGALRELGHEPRVFAEGQALLAAVRERSPDLVITGLSMPGMDGMAVLAALRAPGLHVPVIVMTASAGLDTALAAIRAGAADHLTRPFQDQQLAEVLGRVLRMARLENDNRRHAAVLARRDRLMRQELQMAHTLLQFYMPAAMPQLPGFAAGMLLIPSYSIGGDLIDFYPSVRGVPGRLGVMFADLSGHGVAGALLLMLFKALAGEALRGSSGPGAGIAELNRRLAADFPKESFACATYLELAAGSRTVNFVRGSQEPILLVHADGRVSEYAEGGTPLGMFAPGENAEVNYAEQTLTLAPGDTLLLYTDGVVEAVNPGQEQFGSPALKEWLADNRALPPGELVQGLYREIIRYAGTGQLDDDFTVLAIRAT